MKNTWLNILLLFCVRTAWSELKCNKKDNCMCFAGAEFEFQCPKSHSGDVDVIIHVTEYKDILIDCDPSLNVFDISQLPNITLESIPNFRIRFCPLPTRFKDVLDWFSLRKFELLQFGHRDIEQITLTPEYFEGLSALSSLRLDHNNITYLDENVFINTPNLISLELQENSIKLKPGLFSKTPLLKSLDLSLNKLDNLNDGLLEPLKELQMLHLWDNELTALNAGDFSGLFKLKSLELSLNKIEYISKDAFANLTNLLQINLSRNNITALPYEVFRNNAKLEQILLSGNFKVNLSDYLFSNLPFLKRVDLDNCKLNRLPEHIFENATGLINLTLEANNLRHLHENIFMGLKNLERIRLNNNKIENVDNLFKSLKSLKTLYLHNNLISAIGETAFVDLSNLEEINLRGNKIVQIHFRTFYNKNNLRIINLSHNEYSKGENHRTVLLDDVHNAEYIDFSYNLITQVEDVIDMNNKVRLKQLDLRHNQISSIELIKLQPLSNKLNIRLEFNKITRVDFRLVENISISRSSDARYASNRDPSAVIYLDNNSIACNDCSNYDLLRYTRDELRPEVKVLFDIKAEDMECANRPLNKLPPMLFVCPFEQVARNNSICPEYCMCSWRPYDTSIIVDCSNKELTNLPEYHIDINEDFPFNQTEMHLERNNLTEGLDQNSTGYSNVTKLYLSHNDIETIAWLPPKLQVLNLDGNRISNLNYDVLNALNGSHLVHLKLNDNPWKCDCEAENLTNFLRLHSRQVDVHNVSCANSNRLLIELNRNDLCHEWQGTFIILPLMSAMLVLAIFVALYYRYQQEIKIWLFAHNWCLWWVTEEELDKDKLYDAFISYSHKDEEFVVQNLLPVLEGGPKPYKLCLHYRNWIPGEFIAKQVTNSVLDSRRTLIVLSPNFLESVWAKMEFRTAHTQAMTEGRARVIVVLYGDVKLDGLDSELKTYLKTNTYVKWGDLYFWNKLKYALPHSTNRRSHNNQKLANVMNCIDDKFNLVAPITGSPGTTPPVLTLDPSLLKHPLNFISRNEVETPAAEGGTLLTTTCL